MTIAEAIFLGLLQGLTEFLPVSSSGHLVIGQYILGIHQDSAIFEAVVHLGSLASILIFFRKQLFQLNRQLMFRLIVASLPAVVAGLLLEPYLTEIFSSLVVTTFGLFVTTLALWSTKKLPTQSNNGISVRQALYMGLAQAMAVTPGISRSGSTVAIGLKTGLSRETAFYFSFLMAIPAIIGAFILILIDTNWAQIEIVPSVVGLISSLLSGLVALGLLKKVTSQAKLHWFAAYTLFLFLSLLAYQLFFN